MTDSYIQDYNWRDVMKKLEIIIRPERLDDLKTILNNCNAHGLMITNIMGYGSQKGHKQVYNGVDFGGNLLPKVKVETIVDDDTAEKIIDLVIEEINTGVYGDGKIFVYDVYDAVRIRTGERGVDAL
jgi:nitrogen regulatory protein P-II 1